MKASFLTTFILGFTLLFQVSCGKKSNSGSGGQEQENYSDPDMVKVPYDQFERIVRANDIEAARSFIRQFPKVNPNRLIPGDDTLLCLAIRNNYRKMVEILIERGADLEMVTHSKEDFKMTPLMVASSRGHLHLVKLLLSHNANTESTGGLAERTALHYAIAKNFDDVAIYLMQNGASLETRDGDGRNAYQLATITGSAAIIEYIRGIKFIKDGSAPDSGTFRNLIIQADIAYLSSVLAKHPGIAKRFEDINPLVLAIENADENLAFSMVEMLMVYQVDSNGPQGALTTPLIKAVKTNRAFIAEYLIQRKANVNTQDGIGNSPLYYAIELNLPDMVDLLLAQNARKVDQYTLKNSDDIVYFNACYMAREMASKYNNGQARTDNLNIQLRLGRCRR